MKAIELIRWALQTTEGGVTQIAQSMRYAPLTQPTGSGGNHPLWCVGHMCFVEGAIQQILFGGPHPIEQWKHLFATGTQPVSDPKVYPPFDAVLAKFKEIRARTMQLLEQTGEAGLDKKPDKIPPGFEDLMATYGRSFMALAMHHMVHYGQIADARRVAGLKPLI